MWKQSLGGAGDGGMRILSKYTVFLYEITKEKRKI